MKKFLLSFFFGVKDLGMIVHEEDILEIFLFSPFALNGFLGGLLDSFAILGVFLIMKGLLA